MLNKRIKALVSDPTFGIGLNVRTCLQKSQLHVTEAFPSSAFRETTIAGRRCTRVLGRGGFRWSVISWDFPLTSSVGHLPSKAQADSKLGESSCVCYCSPRGLADFSIFHLFSSFSTQW